MSKQSLRLIELERKIGTRIDDIRRSWPGPHRDKGFKTLSHRAQDVFGLLQVQMEI